MNDDLKVRYKIKHNDDLISFENINDLPDELKQSLKRMFCSWEENTRETAIHNFLKKELIEDSSQLNVIVKEESLSF